MLQLKPAPSTRLGRLNVDSTACQMGSVFEHYQQNTRKKASTEHPLDTTASNIHTLVNTAPGRFGMFKVVQD